MLAEDEDGVSSKSVLYFKKSLLQEVIARAPENWEYTNYSGRLYHSVMVCENEKNNVILKFPEDLKAQVSNVYRIQNPFLWGRYILRKEHLRAKGHSVYEATYYHPVSSMDKTTVMEYNLDYRRYTYKSVRQYDSCYKKPYLYREPKDSKNAISDIETVLIVVKVIGTSESNCSMITKDWDTEYYPEYYIEFF